MCIHAVNAAYTTFEEDVNGTIEKGKLADMIVVSDDPFKIEPGIIKDVKVLMRIVGGRQRELATFEN